MSKEELIGKLQMVYVGDRNALNELIGYYDGLKEVVEIVQQENQKYKEVINKAIEFSNKNWGTWCSNHLEYMTELQNILKEVE